MKCPPRCFGYPQRKNDLDKQCRAVCGPSGIAFSRNVLGGERQSTRQVHFHKKNLCSGPFLHSFAQNVQEILSRFTIEGAGRMQYTLLLA